MDIATEVVGFFARFGPMFAADPVQFALLCIVLLILGFIGGRAFMKQQVTAADQHVRTVKEQVATEQQRVDWLKERLAEKAPNHDLEMKRIEAELAKQARLSEKQKMYPPRKR